MDTTIEKNRFDTWIDNLKPDGDLRVWTSNGIIDIDEVDKFVNEMKGKGAKSIKINLVRFDWKVNEPQDVKEDGPNHPPGCTWKVVGDNKTQVGIVINAAEEIIRDADYQIKAADIFEADDMIRVLIPGDKPKGPIGHNPPPPPK